MIYYLQEILEDDVEDDPMIYIICGFHRGKCVILLLFDFETLLKLSECRIRFTSKEDKEWKTLSLVKIISKPMESTLNTIENNLGRIPLTTAKKISQVITHWTG